MMMIPRRNDFDLFDDVFGDSFFNEGASRLMKTDIKEKKNEYIIDIDLPGYDKEGIKLEIQDGYLTVHASVNKEENDEEKGRFVRKERYSGACSRSFYVGENITEDEIKSKVQKAIFAYCPNNTPRDEELMNENLEYIFKGQSGELQKIKRRIANAWHQQWD